MSEPVGNTPRSSAIPSNSHKAREAAASVESEPREQIQKIVTGKVVARKQPWWKRATDNLVAEDATSVGDFLLTDVMIPAFKNLVYDIITQGSSRALWGTTRARGPVSSAVSSSGVSKISRRYDKVTEEPGRAISQIARATHDFRDVKLDSRQEAINVLEALVNRIERFGSATVSDLYDALGISSNYTDRSWGWTNLDEARVVPDHRGFLLDLPSPISLR